MKKQKTSDWKLIGHLYQITDTGDYDGHYEITNGKISLLTRDDDDESLRPIVDALNDSCCKFYQDDWLEFENKIFKDENAELRERVKELESQLTKYREALELVLQSLQSRRPHTPGLGASINIIKEALKQQ